MALRQGFGWWSKVIHHVDAMVFRVLGLLAPGPKVYAIIMTLLTM